MSPRYSTYVALGDSFTEGVGDHDESRPNGVRGWADRVAEALAGDSPDFRYANLAIRGRKLPAILAEQIEPAVAMGPDLVSIYAGANDILRPRVDIDALMERYDEAIGRLAGTGATVVTFTAFDTVASPGFRSLRGRFATYSELAREIAERHGAVLVDYWRLREFRNWAYWDDDRMHMSSYGHQLMAVEVLDALGVEHDLKRPELEPAEPPSLREHLDWAARHVRPWVARRLTGRSSGDSVTAKRPEPGPV